MRETKVLIVDDEEQMRIALRESLVREEYVVEAASNGLEAIERYRRERFHLVITDVKMKGMNGVELLKSIKEISPDCPVVLITAYGTIDNAVEAMKAGACDYILKPFSIEQLMAVVERVLMGRAGASANSKEGVRAQGNHRHVVCHDEKMKELLSLARSIANSNATVLIQGESGTGKELLARYICTHSPRRAKPFVAINCAAIPESLLESELFGHEKGAFTGAVYTRPGKFEQANGGTLLLDEVSEMAFSLQAKLLRVLQECEIDRIGGRNPIHIDVRVIATTNVDLIKKLREGSFREDLYYRLNVVPLTIPPLRDRKSDILPLVRHFLDRFMDNEPGVEVSLNDDVIKVLMDHDWPGNVRELENVLQRAILLSGGKSIKPEYLFPASQAGPICPSEVVRVGSSVKEMERDLIMRTLASVGGNRTRAAKILDISIRTLRNKLREYGGTTA
ncbi:MAG: sigma-54-dependent Fis family transcriptional regulator [Deltaproteobacteria bacterium]|nr:sigma-54-dependent Fis family transcriptional regulator [Deltaproteobacteria bacterium]